MWTDRCVFEANTTPLPSAFVTLTYDDDHLPLKNGVPVVNADDVRLFRMRLRKHLKRPYKFFFTSEYGEQTYRPHYHGLLFGFNPSDYNDVNALYKAWSVDKSPIGFFSVDFFNASNARYCLKYISKEYNEKDRLDYEKRGLEPLFHRMSKGIGKDWFFQHLAEIKAMNGYLVNGKVRPLPRYYAKMLELLNTSKMSVEEFSAKFSKYNDRFQMAYGKDFNPFDPVYYDEEIFSDSVRLRDNAVKELLCRS